MITKKNLIMYENAINFYNLKNLSMDLKLKINITKVTGASVMKVV